MTSTSAPVSAAKRIYVVSDGTPDHSVLVRASSQAQAVHHVVSSRYTAKVASQSDLVVLLGVGVKVQEAGNE